MLDLSSTHRKKVVGRHKINDDLCVSRLKTIIHSVGGLDPSDVDIIMGCREKTRGIKSVEFACMSRVFSIM